MCTPQNYCNGRLRVSLEPREMRMSHWLYAPKVEDLGQGRVLLDLSSGQWDLLAADESALGLDLRLRKYPGDRREVTLNIHLADLSLWLDGQAVAEAELEAALDAALDRPQG